MSQNTVSKRTTLKSIINDILAEKEDATTVDSLPDDVSLTDDLGLDSLDLAEVTVRLEDKYDVDVFEDEVVDAVGEVLNKINT